MTLPLPPILDTDLPTSEQFFTHAITPSTYPHNFKHRYSASDNGIMSMALSPAGHGVASKSLFASFATADDSFGGSPALHVGYHSMPGTVEQLTTGWQVLPTCTMSNLPNSAALSDRAFALLASQRLGSYTYVFAYASQLTAAPTNDNFYGGYDDGYGDYGYTYGGNDVTDGHLRIWRIGPSNAIQTRVSYDFNNANSQNNSNGQERVSLFGLDSSALVASPTAANGSASFFVSDDATPFIWHVSGDISLSNVYAMAFPDDGTNPGVVYTRTDQGLTVYGRLGHYFQSLVRPSNVHGYGPALVFPWSSGNYGFPELWYFVPNGLLYFDVYRAQWKPGVFRKAYGLQIDDASFDNGTRRFPSRNPRGYGFEYNWFDAAHKVTTIGPFPGLNLYKGTGTPATGQLVYPQFQVMRDPNRIGQMHITVGGTRWNQ